MTYQGVPRETRGFLAELEAENNKAWFDANRSAYQSDFLAPAEELVSRLGSALRAELPAIRAEPRINGSIRRINRDVRFSADKSPYKCRLHMVFWEGDKPMASSGLHLVIRPDGVGAGVGHWMFGKPELQRYHDALHDQTALDELETAVSEARAGAGMVLGDPALKRVPRDQTDSPGADWYRYRGLVVRGDLSQADRVFSPECIDYLIAVFRPMLPLHRWLVGHVFRPRP
ncbi:MAG: DUF2461 domain-containing protein [Minwuia sp.]|nr:DUF2461 domain-containing protein [Minwuia sp.]